MDNIDVLVLKALRDWRSAGQHALLATVVRGPTLRIVRPARAW